MKRIRGFTLVELLVVIAIIGILSSALLPQLNSITAKARAAKIVSVSNALKTACNAYYADLGGYAYEYAAPWYTANTYHRLSLNYGAANWKGPYLQSVLSRSHNPYGERIWVYSSTSNWITTEGGAGFDLNGDGTGDTTGAGNAVVFYAIPLDVAEKVNDMIDGDTSTNANWRAQGEVEYYGTYYLSIYLTGGR